MSIGQNIKNLRLYHGLLQKDLALIAGVSNKTVSAWEKDRTEPRMGAIQKMADHFGIKKSDIIEPSKTDVSDETINVNSEERELVTEYRTLSTQGKKILQGMMGQLKEFAVAATL